MSQQTLRRPAVPMVTLLTTDVDQLGSTVVSDNKSIVEPEPFSAASVFLHCLCRTPSPVKGVRLRPGPVMECSLTASGPFLIGVFHSLSDDDEHFHQASI